MDSTRPPLSPGTRLIHRLARYILRLLREQLFPGHPPTPWPKDIPIRLQVECHQIVAVVVKAFLNAEHLAWALHDYKVQKGKLTAAELLARFPPASRQKGDGTPYIKDEPFIVVDSVGRILLWYLPNIVSSARQAVILEAISWLSFDAPETPLLTKPCEFRRHEGTFTPSGPLVRSGVATFASCWPVPMKSRDQKDPSSSLRPSTTFSDPRNGGLEFLEKVSESMAILGAILAAVHPAQFEAGLDVLAHLNAGSIVTQEPALLRQVLELWSTPFTAFSVVNNRDTWLHLDPKSPPRAYDLLYTGGRYSDARFEVPSLGLRCRYNPGTVVALLAALFEHGISPVVGDRVGISQFFRQVMIEQVPCSRLPTTMYFADFLNLFSSDYYFKD
ncbi:hypothetical protein CC1G_13115 [Coprinopsis cinerea okayama7|uniref:2OGFeDO JBP1/TET oxygenase domain-containing protein n=1 Tax=Coprinopsis cinerea (strain Okayama-7 / 130 / ATCC MYA-4618 / FGSC 9003) TaxID=240176 RepID=A8PAU9_COPC7|nr:hypothetical protein CC1G_13115 [Coprinopsis cinerea okayama7\|eukprot:XP_001840057.2 hypothetical protein CC1G_13115 [Coprinopsis cinerea okayama7\